MSIKLAYILLLYITFLWVKSSYSTVSKISQQFMIKWDVSKNDFQTTPSSYSTECQCLRKTLYKFDDIGNLTFQLCLKSNKDFYYVIILPASPDYDIYKAVYLEYAYVATADRIFDLIPPKYYYKTSRLRLGDISEYEEELFLNETVTVHCRLSVKAYVKSSFTSRDNIQCKSSILPTMNDPPRFACLERGYKDDTFGEYLFSGKIPVWSERTAMNFLEIAKNPVPIFNEIDRLALNAHAVEYLVKNLTPVNVLDILKLSIKVGIHNLRGKCLTFLTNDCKIGHKRY